MGPETVHAALLIDFDNVTMGMRSDLSKELKTLLDSDVIKGKVSVQRAYADWRRYPQYIVPLSEASVDLIFAPAYGSNKKNATDIRMAIDGMELVFVRPEIGTYILLTGDSDFSSLVLKLKEYGKYVIGVGIQESSSDILVQNCDEYYSYTSLTGLQKTTSGGGKAGQDPWGLVTKALEKMVSRDDVMRSDRLKQVMQEIEPNFDESAVGFSKFSKFMAEASSKGLVELKKMENGQYEVAPPSGRPGRGGGGRSRRDRGGRSRGGRERRERNEPRPPTSHTSDGGGGDPLQDAYDLLVSALKELSDGGRGRVRDSDVKRKMLALSPAFDETELGFAKFSKFLTQATDHGMVETDRTQRGNYEVSLPGGESAEGPEQPSHRHEEPADRDEEPQASAAAERRFPEPSPEPRDQDADTTADRRESGLVEISPSGMGGGHRGFGPRGGSTRRRGGEDQVPLFEGQVVTTSAVIEPRPSAPPAGGGTFDASGLGLPTDPEAIVRYMTHRYKGVGEKTAQTLVEQFGPDVFRHLRDNPTEIASHIPAGRADQVLEAWDADYQRRLASQRARGGG